MTQRKAEETRKYMKAIFRQRNSSIDKSRFEPALAKDPEIHPKAHNERSLSPNYQLRALKAKLEAEMRAEKEIVDKFIG